MADSVETAFVTEKRLTDSDLDEEKGYLSIPAGEFKNALLFLSSNEGRELRRGRFMPVTLVEYNSKGTVTIARTTLSLGMLNDDKGYVLGGRWNEVKKRNEEKFEGVNGLHAVIQLYCSRPQLDDQVHFALLVKEPEIPERLKKHLEAMQDASEAVLLTEKRLTDVDVGQHPVFLCFLSIPEHNLNNANLLTPQETELLDLGQSVPVRLVDINGAEPVETLLMLKKQATDYMLNEQWNQVIRRNENKVIGVDGLHAVIQLWFFRDHSSTLHFAFHIAEEAKTGDVVEEEEASSGGYEGGSSNYSSSWEHSEASASYETGSRTSTSTWGLAGASSSHESGPSNTNTGDAEAASND